MSYLESIIGKKIDALIYNDFVEYFRSPHIESNIAEYKSFNPRGNFEDKLQGIYKAVCALLNSEGGIVVWGAPTGSRIEGRKEKEFSGNLTPLNRTIEKDYLINKLSDNITPLPNTIEVKILENDGACIVIIEVNKSPSAPHQTIYII